MSDKSALIALLAKRSVKLGDFTLASGRKSDFYIDARLTTMSPEGLSLVGALGLAAIQSSNWEVASIGGLTLGADPISYAISYASATSSHPLRAFTVRKEAKQHGTGRLIEGPFNKGDRVAIIEDVITTGASALQACKAVTDAGGAVSGVLALVDREEGGRETLENAGLKVLSLVTKRDLLTALHR